MNPEYAPIPQPEDIPVREREDAMGAYLMMFGALAAGLPLPIINLLAAVIYYYVNRDKGRFVKFHTLQSLYSQIPTTLLNAGLIFWIIRTIFRPDSLDGEMFMENLTSGHFFIAYLCLVVLANLLYVIFSIVAAVRARKGRMYYFFFFGKLAYHKAFSVKGDSKSVIENRPPV